MFKLPFILLLTPILSAKDGQTLFTTNCSACHLPDTMQVGPSMIEIAKLYKGKPDEFIKWCNEPQHKRKGSIQMPSMAHVGNDNLKLILAHIEKSTRGLTEKKVKGSDKFSSSPSLRKRPLVQRIFMPNASPAAIAVALNDDLHFCWDAGPCRLRYLWKGDFIDGWPYWRANGNSFAKINGNILLTETQSPLPTPQKTKFLGYSLNKGIPTFKYTLDGKPFTETLTPAKDGKNLLPSLNPTNPLP